MSGFDLTPINILYRKKGWKPRRYILKYAPTSDYEIEELLATRDEYELFYAFRYVPNNAPIPQINLVSEFKRRNRLKKEIIEIDGEKQSVIRLTNRNLNKFVWSLKLNDGRYIAVDDDISDSE